MKIDRANDIAYAGMDPREAPAYSIAEAARYLAMPVSTLRRWIATGRLANFAAPERRVLSFQNLVEVYGILRRAQPSRVVDRVVRDRSGAPVAFFPAMTGRVGLVVIDPFQGFGQPTIAGSGIRTAVVASRHRAGEALGHLADDYGRPVVEIRAAVRFEQAAYRQASSIDRATLRC